MDVALRDLIVILVALADGTTSLYRSNGAGIFGAGEHAQVAETRGSLSSLTQQFDTKLQPTNTFPFPKPDKVRFYLLTFT